jgi:adenylate cyclase
MVSAPRLGPAELEAAGLYESDADGASQRLALLEYLIGLGATLDDLVAAQADELPLLASMIALWGDRELLTIDEVAEAAGVERSLVARGWRAAGLPAPDLNGDTRTFSRRDVEMLEIMRAAIELFGQEVTIQLLRVIGAAAARVADASASAFVVNVASQAINDDPSGLALARANVESLRLLDSLTRGFDTLLRHHIERTFRPIETMENRAGVDLVRRSVGFADLVDSTSWTQQLDLNALSRALTRFDATASEIVVGREGRVVKLIGDEVMFVANDAGAAVDIALALISAFASDDVLPPVRVGIATGEVLARDGDYSGSVVNLAARAVKIASPSTLLVDNTTRDALDDGPSLAISKSRLHSLKGLTQPVQLSQVTHSTDQAR